MVKHVDVTEFNINVDNVFSYSTTFITCPADPQKTLGIKLPFLVMIIKNLKKYFTFEVQVSFHLCRVCHQVNCRLVISSF